MDGVFTNLAVVVGLAAAGGILTRWLRQPMILGYILAGGVYGLLGGGSREFLEVLGRLGVTLLLFLVGMELSVGDLKNMGRTVLLTGTGQIGVTAVVGYFIARALGFGLTDALYIGVALTFSSTIVVVKLLSEKKELGSLHGKIALGSLLVQDFAAMGILVMLAGWGKGAHQWTGWGWTAGKGLGLALFTVWLGEKVMPRVVEKLSRSTELVFVFSLAWCLAAAAVVGSASVGFSLELGGLLAGLSLAGVPEHFQIKARIRPVRDFFMTVFFVWLGANAGLADLGRLLVPGAILAGYVLIGNPLIMMGVLGVLGYKRRTAFLAGITMAQVSEFSLVIVAAAVKLGLADQTVFSLVTIVGVVTMVGGTYLVTHGERLYRRIGNLLPFWERGGAGEKAESNEWKGHTVIFGYHRVGSAIRPVLQRQGKQIVMVDFDPGVVEKLRQEGVNVVFGDAGDPEIYDDVGLPDARQIISTVPDLGDQLVILEALGRKKKGRRVIMTGADKYEADRLYRAGADYVLLPYSVGGEFLAQMLEKWDKKP